MDYGLAYRYRVDGRPKAYKEDPRRKHDGTLEFTSIDAHKGVSECTYAHFVYIQYVMNRVCSNNGLPLFRIM